MLQRRIGMICTSSGWAVWTSPRANSRRERALRLTVEKDKTEIIASGDRRLDWPQPSPLLPDLQRPVEDRADRDQTEELMTRDRGQAGGGDAAAVAAVGVAAELARRDRRLEVGGDG